jgi:hypothetical protein
MGDDAAAAVRGFRWPVGVTGLIAAPAGDLWAVMSMPGNLELCHPFCAKNPVEMWSGVGSRDEVHYLNGVVFERRFSRWIEGVGYDVDIGRPDGKSSSVSWRVTPIDEESCTLRIVVYPHVVQNLPVAIRWLPHLAWARPRLKAYLSSVVQGFGWYVERGEPVPRNQFGSHPWFTEAFPRSERP